MEVAYFLHVGPSCVLRRRTPDGQDIVGARVGKDVQGSVRARYGSISKFRAQLGAGECWKQYEVSCLRSCDALNLLL